MDKRKRNVNFSAAEEELLVELVKKYQNIVENKKTDMVMWKEKEEWTALYRQHTALWKVKSTEYSDRNLKNEAYNVLIEKYKEVDPNADKEIVKKKINSLRTNYQKELKKVKASYKSGSGTDDIYVPPLWYYNELNFLQDQEVPVDGSSTIILQSEDETQDDGDLSINAQEQNIPEVIGSLIIYYK
ncbi:hypothetical protein QTP88_026546 [Uroleucon formosanum]